MEVTVDMVAGGVAVLGGAVLMFNKLGWLTFGNNKKQNGNGKCPDPQCHESVVVMSHRVGSIEKKVDELTDAQKVVLNSLVDIKTDLGIIKATQI